MALYFFDLDEKTRALMLEELQFDLSNKTVYLSARLNDFGIKQYPEFLQQAITSGNDASLAASLKSGCLNSIEQRRTKKGITNAQVPVNAHEMLAEGEFNRYYIRALCRRAIDEQSTLEVYRAKEVSNPRLESQSKLGQAVDPTALLNDLRSNIGIDTHLGLPAGPNSGLSIRLTVVNIA